MGSRLARGRHRSTIAAALAAVVVASTASATAAQYVTASTQTRSWVVVLEDGADPAGVADAVGATRRQTYSNALHGFAADLTPVQLEALERDRRVVSVHANRVVQHSPTLDATDLPPGQPSQLVGAAVQRIGALESRTAAIDEVPNDLDVDIAILDGGVGPHVDLNIAGGVNCASGDGFHDHQSYGHGTLVAGLAAARDNAFGVVGVAPGARIWSVRVLEPDGSGSLGNVLCGLDWVSRNAAHLDVANMSFGFLAVGSNRCDDPGDPLHSAICRVVRAGVTVTAGAGAGSSDASGFLPAAYPEVITASGLADADGRPGGLGSFSGCGSVEQDDTFVDQSNYGAAVDIAAPAMCIRSTSLGDSYADVPAFVPGLSFSAALVAGAAALVRTAHPDWTPAQVQEAIVRQAEPGPIAGDPDGFAEGVLDVSGF